MTDTEDPIGDTQPPDVEFIRVTKAFGNHIAVNDVSFRVNSGEFLALLGPSGCGKTTCLRMIAGFEECTEGDIRITGLPANGLRPAQRPVNTVFQDYALFSHLNVRKNVEFGLKQRKVPSTQRRQLAIDALAMVRLEPYSNHMPSQLSGGQRQRVALARALVLKPKVLLLDEPLAALDLQLRKGMQDELRRLHRDLGITFIFVTHDQGEAMGMADRIAVMSNGRIEQIGTPEEIYRYPQTAFVASFIGEMNFLDAIAQENEALVTCAMGGLRIPSGSHPSGPAIVGIRPESLSIVHSGEANGISSQLVDSGLLGETCWLRVELTDGSVIRIRRPREEWNAIGQLRRGEPVHLSLRADEIVVFPRDGSI